jgi:xanthine dehydrogenase large subunit
VIDYEPLPPVLTIEEAMGGESFVSPPQLMVRGEVEPALASAPHRLSGELRCGGQDHFYLEGQIALATPGEGSDMHVWSSTQHPTEVQHGVAHLLDLPFNAVTVEVRRMGGAFGGKESQATIIAGIAAVLAWKARRPVKLRLPREDDMRATGKRHPFLIRYDVGFDPDGRILALDLTLAANAGNVADHTPAVLTRALCHADNCYFLPRVRLRGLQDQHGVEHRVPRLRRAAGHAGDRDHHRSDCVPLGSSRPCGAATQFLWHRPQRRDSLRHAGRGQYHRTRRRRARPRRRARRLATRDREFQSC